MQSGGGWDECPSLGHLAGHGRERERDILVEIFWWKCVEDGILELLEFRKME